MKIKYTQSQIKKVNSLVYQIDRRDLTGDKIKQVISKSNLSESEKELARACYSM